MVESDVELFLFAAKEKGLLNDTHANILKSVCPTNATLTDLFDIVSVCGIDIELRALDELAEHVKSLLSKPAEETARTGTSSHWQIPLELEWFCYHGVTEGLIDRDECLCIVASVEEAADLLSFAQTMIDADICDDFSCLQGFLDTSMREAAKGKHPPLNVFEAVA